MSPDDSEFEQVYHALPPGLVTVASGGGNFRLLQSFFFSLKGAAIRIGANAMHFNWNGSRENWDVLGGLQYFTDFIDIHQAQGVRLFFVDGSPQSGSLQQRCADMIRGPMMRGSIEHDIAALIHQHALAKNVTVIVTAIAEVVAAEHAEKALKDLDTTIHAKQKRLEVMRDETSKLERQFQLPNVEAQIAALPKDIAEQVLKARDAMPGFLLAIQEAEADIAESGQLRKRLKKKQPPSQLLASLRTRLYSGEWKGILLKQDISLGVPTATQSAAPTPGRGWP
jgi:hypothetical protein